MKLADFIYTAAKQHNTSLGNNGAFPQREDVSFDYYILKKRYETILASVEREIGYIPTMEDAEKMLARYINEAAKEERPLRPQLEKLCESLVCNTLSIPQETLLINCTLVDGVEPNNVLRILPEDDEENSYTFADVEDSLLMNKEILKRRMINSLVQGVSYCLMQDTYDSTQIQEWSQSLVGYYKKIIALNDFLLFNKQESISDKNPMLGAYVETHLGKGTEKTVIDAQGVIYPLLLQETYRGLFELYGSHGLPEETKKANYILHHADFLVAEPWDLRMGVGLWEAIEGLGDNFKTDIYPYVFSTLSQLPVEEFNDMSQNLFLSTQKGKDFMNKIIIQVKHDSEYQTFKQDIERFNLEKCVIEESVEEAVPNTQLIYTDDFKSWFGDWENNPKKSSFVVDKNGMPLMCYHSTQADFEEFDPSKIGSGGAGAYHGYGFNFTTLLNNTYGGNVKVAFLNARKPLTSLKKKITLNKLVKILLEVDKGEADTIACEFTGNYVKINGMGYYNEILRAAQQIYEYAESDLDIYANISIASSCSPEKVIGVFSKLGYDSSVEYNTDGQMRVVVVFNPSQIWMVKKGLTESKGLMLENKYDNQYNEALQNLQNFINSKAEEYGQDCWYMFSWMKSNHPEIEINPQDKETYYKLKNEADNVTKLWNQTENEEELAAQKNTNEPINLFQLAIKEFGTTSMLSQAGYILPDGKLLNFGGNGDRYTDHRAIEKIYKLNNIQIWDDNYRYNYVVDFLNHGAIRIDAHTGLIDMTKEPTSAEYRVLKSIARRTQGEIYMDFTDERGNTIHSVEYDDVKPQRFVADIMKFYREGIRPLGDIQESNENKQALTEGDNALLSWFQGSKVVNPDGTPKLMYRGDKNQIDSFDRSYSSSSNLYGTGFYFTESKSHALQYGNAQAYYLRIVHPLSTTAHEITRKQLYKYLIAVDKNEDYGLYNYGYGSTPESVLNSIYGKSDFAMIQDVNACCIGDLVEATILFNQVNGTDYDGFILDTETVVFDNSQIKRAEDTLKEDKQIINEGLSDTIYHFCSLDSLYNILKTGKLSLTMSTNHADAYHKRNLFYLSTQRSKSSQLGYAGNSSGHGRRSIARIELDGALLKRDGYQGKPIDYWGGSMGKQSDIGLNASRLQGRNVETQSDKESVLKSQGSSSNFEFEDRIFSKNPTLPFKYIKRIDCLDAKALDNNIDKAILLLADKKGINVSFYDKEKDFVIQTEFNINNKILNSSLEYVEINGKSDEEKLRFNRDTVATLCAALLYYNFYNHYSNGQPSQETYDEMNTVLSKFGLERYYDFCKTELPTRCMNLEYQYLGTSFQEYLRKLNTDSTVRNSLSENIMLFAQCVFNHYNVKSCAELRNYFKTHPWKQKRPSDENVLETVECIELRYGGSSSSSIFRADDKSFWGERSPFYDKDYFYQEITNQLDEEEWNVENGYEIERKIHYKSKNANSFKKYLQYLMQNDELSLYKGTVILNQILANDQAQMETMFGFSMEPIEVDKETFIRLENKITYSDYASIRDSLFGSEDGYYEYRWPKNESFVKSQKMINEILDKEYMKPLWDYLKNGQKYSSGGSYSPSERMVVPFFDWACKTLSESDFKQFSKALNNCSQLQGKIKGCVRMGHQAIECYSKLQDGIKKVPTQEFLRSNARRLFTITYNDPQLSLYWDKFYFFINGKEGKDQLKRGQYLDADTVLMNPELKKPMWLVHFTTKKEDALDICQNGFKYGLGVNQMSKLGYTNKDIEKTSKQGKYLYAYNADEITNNFFPADTYIPKEQWAFDNTFDQKVWENAIHFAIMFIAPGIEVRHDTDNQQQVIFNADTARDFVLLSFNMINNEVEWNVGTVNGHSVYKNRSLTKVIDWVMRNFNQYKKLICQKH